MKTPGEIAPLEPGQLVVKNMMDIATATGFQIPPSARGIVGRQAKALFEDGFELDMITAACWMAVLRGKPELTERIAGDLSLAAAGARMTDREYETKVALWGAERNPSMLDEHRQREERRRR